MSEIFACRIKEARLNKRRTQLEMSKMLGITAVAYGGWERGSAEPNITNLVKLCQYFDVSADWIIGLDRSNQEQKPMIVDRINALKSEADQAAATLARLVGQIKEMEKCV